MGLLISLSWASLTLNSMMCSSRPSTHIDIHLKEHTYMEGCSWILQHIHKNDKKQKRCFCHWQDSFFFFGSYHYDCLVKQRVNSEGFPSERWEILVSFCRQMKCEPVWRAHNHIYTHFHNASATPRTVAKLWGQIVTEDQRERERKDSALWRSKTPEKQSSRALLNGQKAFNC